MYVNGGKMPKTITGNVVVSLPQGKGGDKVKVTVPKNQGEKGLVRQARNELGVDETYPTRVESWWDTEEKKQ
jgi:hypothetical protein